MCSSSILVNFQGFDVHEYYPNNNNIDNLQQMCEHEIKIHKVDVEDHVFDMHMTTVVWGSKVLYESLSIGICSHGHFTYVKNNQVIGLTQNLVM